MNEKYQDVINKLTSLLIKIQNTVITCYRGSLDENKYKELMKELFLVEQELDRISGGIDTFTDLQLLNIIGEMNNKVSYLITTTKEVLKKENIENENQKN